MLYVICLIWLTDESKGIRSNGVFLFFVDVLGNDDDNGVWFANVVQLFKEICQVIFLDGFSYFLSLQNTLEILTYITSLISLESRNYYTQSSYGSIAVLFAFIVFPFFIQKLRMFGIIFSIIIRRINSVLSYNL
jgi:hypothetical protein